MSVSHQDLISKDAVKGLEGIKNRILNLERNDYYRPIQGDGVTSVPPTQLEITAILGDPSAFSSEMVGLIIDIVNSRKWLVFSDKSIWHYVQVDTSSSPLEQTFDVSANLTAIKRVVRTGVVPDPLGEYAIDLQEGSTASTRTATGDASNISGGYNNTSSGNQSTVGGGSLNNASGSRSTVGGGILNTASGLQSTVDGGVSNNAVGDRSTVGGGSSNNANNDDSVIAGGVNNTTSGDYSTVGGGITNTASDTYATIAGGYGNTASGEYSTISGGSANLAAGDYTVAGGRNAKANHQGAWVQADSVLEDATSITNNEALLQFTGGIRLVTATDGSGNPTKTVTISTNGIVTYTSNTERALQRTELGIASTASGSFTTTDGKTVTVANGIITSIV